MYSVHSTLKFLGMQGKTNDFELLRKFLLLRGDEKLVDECGKKVIFFIFQMLNFCFAKSDLRVLNDILRKNWSKSK